MAAVRNRQRPFSVLMSVYGGDMPQHLDAAIRSVVHQTWPADQIVLVKDGPLSEQLDDVIEKWENEHPGLFRVVRLAKNVGLGLALRAGMQKCSHEIIARMDADDVSVADRFDLQLKFLQDHPEIDVVSSWLGVFDGDADDILFESREPGTPEEIRRVAKFRCPIMHGGCMYRRSAVLSAGGYSNWRGMEDYHLWVRMLLNGSRMASIPKILYKNRRNAALASRRRGLRRLRMQVRLQREFLRIGFISVPRFVCNVVLRAVVCLMPYAAIQRTRFVLRLDKAR